MGSPDIIIALAILFFAFIFPTICHLINKVKKKYKKCKDNSKTRNRRAPSTHYEIQERIKKGKQRRRNIKISSRHFPPSPAHEKRLYDRTKRPEDEEI